MRALLVPLASALVLVGCGGSSGPSTTPACDSADRLVELLTDAHDTGADSPRDAVAAAIELNRVMPTFDAPEAVVSEWTAVGQFSAAVAHHFTGVDLDDAAAVAAALESTPSGITAQSDAAGEAADRVAAHLASGCG